MEYQRYTIHFENKNVLILNGVFNNAELIHNHKDIANFIDDKGHEYMIPMSKVLYIESEGKM